MKPNASIMMQDDPPFTISKSTRKVKNKFSLSNFKAEKLEATRGGLRREDRG